MSGLAEKYSRYLAILVAGLAIPATTLAQSEPLAITGASLIDPVDSAPPRVATVVVDQGRITAIIDGAGVPPAARLPAGVRIIDAAGRFLLPGLWDMHTHLAALTPVGQSPERYVGHGVLHVRDMGGHLDSLVPLRSAIARGDRTGPTLVMAGPTLNGIQPAGFHRQVTTAEEARTAVRELHAAGVDLIKVHRATGREAFDAIAAEATRLGLPFAGHVPLVMGWDEAARAGIRSIEHIQTIFENLEPDPSRVIARFPELAAQLHGALGDSLFGAMARHGTFFDPTLVGYETSIAAASPAVASLRRQAFERMKPLVAKAARAGVRIVAGTDVLEHQGEALIRELELLAETGLSPREALAAATVTAAEAAGHPLLGRLMVGTEASFLVLDRSPLEDVAHLRTLRGVVLRGRYLDQEELVALRTVGVAPDPDPEGV